MRFFHSLFIAAFIFVMSVSPALADNPVIASGGGYKSVVNALNAAFAKKTGQSMDLMYGNMGKVTTLAKQSGKVSIVIGDETFLKGAGLPLTNDQILGKGKLVLVFAKDSQFSKLEDLDNPKAQRIALPDTKKAIYGRAARQFLQSTGRMPAIQPRLVEVATVPQVFSYLNTNEVDMGFLNLTHTLSIKDKIGGYIIIDEASHAPIRIMAALMKNAPAREQALAFLEFLKTPEAQELIHKYGL